MTDGNRYEDILGFTRQTETLITGLGGTPDVIEEFRKKNISIEELPDLNELDLIKLGADYKFVSTFLSQIKNTLKKSSENLTLQYRFEHLLEILKSGQNQIDLIAAFIAYARIRLAKEQINLFVDPDTNLRASQALKIASAATLKEVDDIKGEVDDLETYMSTIDNIPKKKKYYNFCIVIGGLGLTACALLHLCKKCYIKIN